MTEVVSVKFGSRGKAYFFNPSGITASNGDYVIVETAKGLEYGQCVRGNHPVRDASIVKPLRPVVRLATEADIKTAQAGKEKEKEAFDYCQGKIVDFGLDMKLVDVEYGFEGNKILFFFTSEGRVDFRELVKDLAAMFRTRIELRQIGVRDEAKMIGGFGVCGKVFCCSQFLTDFHPVSIKMAKTQGLSINPTKISGTCGRLMCCLKYEEAAYEELVKKAPKTDAFVETPFGKGTIVNVNLLRGNAKVRLEDGVDTTLKTFTFDELAVLGGKGRRQEYIAAKAEGRLEEAGFSTAPLPELERIFEANRQPLRDSKTSPDTKPHGSGGKGHGPWGAKDSKGHRSGGKGAGSEGRGHGSGGKGHHDAKDAKASSNERKPHHERKQPSEHRKRQSSDAMNRPNSDEADKISVPIRYLPLEGEKKKKHYNKRRKGGYGKGKK